MFPFDDVIMKKARSWRAVIWSILWHIKVQIRTVIGLYIALLPFCVELYWPNDLLNYILWNLSQHTSMYIALSLLEYIVWNEHACLLSAPSVGELLIV